jgi:hypothetical protein
MDNSDSEVNFHRGPIMFLSAEAIQSVLDVWLDQNNIALEQDVSYQWMYDKTERPIGVNVWHTELFT